jgi:hypothetical protein
MPHPPPPRAPRLETCEAEIGPWQESDIAVLRDNYLAQECDCIGNFDVDASVEDVFIHAGRRSTSSGR